MGSGSHTAGEELSAKQVEFLREVPAEGHGSGVPVNVGLSRLLRELFDNPHYDFGMEAASACRKESVQVPLCCFLPRTDDRMHQKMVSTCYNTSK